jgi:hypothetical protein
MSIDKIPLDAALDITNFGGAKKGHNPLQSRR